MRGTIIFTNENKSEATRRGNLKAGDLEMGVALATLECIESNR